MSLFHRLNEEASSYLEASLTAKEKIISELHYELHKIERTLGNEREEHLAELKRLNGLLNEKASVPSCAYFYYQFSTQEPVINMPLEWLDVLDLMIRLFGGTGCYSSRASKRD